MNPVMWSLAISAAGLILSILYQIWARANAQGVDKQSLLQLSNSVSGLVTAKDDSIRFQAGMLEFVTTQKQWNGGMETRVNTATNDIARIQGREESRNNK